MLIREFLSLIRSDLKNIHYNGLYTDVILGAHLAMVDGIGF